MGRMVDVDELVGIPEIAAIAEVVAATAYEWTKDETFPEPVIRHGLKFRLWLEPQVQEWLRTLRPARAEPTHGTQSMYSVRRCRCDLCRAANTETQREYRARRKAASWR